MTSICDFCDKIGCSCIACVLWDTDGRNHICSMRVYVKKMRLDWQESVSAYVDKMIDSMFADHMQLVEESLDGYYYYNIVYSYGRCDTPRVSYDCQMCGVDICHCAGCYFDSTGQFSHCGTYGCATRSRKKVC